MMQQLAPAPPYIILGVTGASGTILALRLLKELLLIGARVDVVFTAHAGLVMQQETGITLSGRNPEEKREGLLNAIGLDSDLYAPWLEMLQNQDVGARPASGTHLHNGMVIAPCSMGTLAKIRAGTADSLLLRAADVTLKEHRPLILLPRETPFNAIHLENMLALSRLGVHLIPPMLSFYSPEFLSLEGQVLYSVGKTLDHLGFAHTLYERWPGLSAQGPNASVESIYKRLLNVN